MICSSQSFLCSCIIAICYWPMVSMCWAAIACWEWSVFQTSVKMPEVGCDDIWTSWEVKADPNWLLTLSTRIQSFQSFPLPSWISLGLLSGLKCKLMSKSGVEEKSLNLTHILPWAAFSLLSSSFGCVWWPKNVNYLDGKKCKALS